MTLADVRDYIASLELAAHVYMGKTRQRFMLIHISSGEHY